MRTFVKAILCFHDMHDIITCGTGPQINLPAHLTTSNLDVQNAEQISVAKVFQHVRCENINVSSG